MLTYGAYQQAAQRFAELGDFDRVFDEFVRLPHGDRPGGEPEAEARIYFARVLYRFHGKHPTWRRIYLDAITDCRRGGSLSIRSRLILGSDQTDHGQYHEAYGTLTALLGSLRRPGWTFFRRSPRNAAKRWRTSVLFQLVRLGAACPDLADVVFPTPSS